MSEATVQNDKLSKLKELAKELPGKTVTLSPRNAFFIDADKGGYPAYLEHALRIVRPGGLILADNAFAFGKLFSPDAGDDDVAAIRAFNDEVASVDALDAVIAPFGDGCWVGVRR